ncbi:hypothetical protein EX895_000960 [Sporisorium graminicola]|uniref:Uncharacterized protein n=1 Tax=Sporisorium graminicola TaxID=280036 RepID=A0A4U7L5Z4_9BASI|nr:hypothetical protein EX895_000960 [Sporisorium graminicola]TKY90962.1 hypothetical protein EX895_000960 [Sporisorium graminicola]
MNGRLSSTKKESASPAADPPSIPPAQAVREQTAAVQSPNGHLQAPTASSHQLPGDFGSSSFSNYPSRSLGFDYDSSRPESSAQAAARYAATSPDSPSVPRPLEHAFDHLSSPLSPDAPPGRIEHTNDTFGRTSGKSAISEPQDSQASRRKTSPTERGAFSYLASSCSQPSASTQNDGIAEYLKQGSVRGHRQDKIDALEKELNLSETSSPVVDTGNIANDHDGDDDNHGMRTAGALKPASLAAQATPKGSHPTLFGIGSDSDTPDRTFGRPSHDQSRQTTNSGGSRPPEDRSRPSHSDTTSSRDTDLSNDPAYGVGEAGGSQQLAVVTRTLTPHQLQHQQELDRISQQRDAVTPISYSTALGSPTSARAAQRTSHQSNATVMATTTSLSSSSTPKHDARLSRQTATTSPSVIAQPLISSEANEHQPAFGHRPLFEGEVVRDGSGSQDSINALNSPASPQTQEGLAPTRSASVRVKTPIFGNTLAELPPGQRASMVGALHESAAAPFPSTGSMHGAPTNLTSASPSSSAHADYATQSQSNYPAGPSQAYLYGPSPQAVGQRQYEATRELDFYSAQPHHHDDVVDQDDGYARKVLDDRARTPHLPQLGDMYAGAPKFPPSPYAQYRDLRLSSRVARVHHTILPLLTYAHIPATLFLDYNVLFSLTQIALHPDNAQTGIRTAWWIALGIYAGCVLVWLVGVVVLYEGFWSFRRRWTVSQPLVMPIYLSNPAFTRTAIKDYSLYSLLYRARSTGRRRDSLIESFWHYSQNWPTVLTLVPRGVISAILLVLYKPAGPALVTRGARDPFYFDQDTERLSRFAFIVITFQAAWAAWKLGVLLVANIGLAATLGFKSLIQQEQDRNAVANTEMAGFAGYSRSALAARQSGSPVGGEGMVADDGDVVQRASHRRWAWRWRAEDRIRAILFDAGLLQHQPVAMHGWRHEQKEAGEAGADQSHAGASPFQPTQMHSTMNGQTVRGDETHGQTEQQRDWDGAYLRQSQTGLALTSPEAIQPEFWATGAHTQHTDDAAGLAPAAPILQSFHVQHLESSPSNEGGDISDASDPYSPAPLPIGRSPRSKEQLRSASSMSSRNDPASLRASSISSLNRLAALNVQHSESPDVAQDDPSSALGVQPSNVDSTVGDVHASSSARPLQSSSDAGPLSEWRGRKRPRSSPVPADLPGLNPGGMASETRDWLQTQIDEESDERGEQEERGDAEAAFSKAAAFDNDGRIMHTFVPMPASFAMSKDPSLAGSPDHGGSDTKHGSWTAAPPNPELFAGKPATLAVTLPPRRDADVHNASSTSLGSLVKGGRSGASAGPRLSGHGYEASSEDGMSLEGIEGSRKPGRNSLLGRMTNKSSSESSRRSGSGGRTEGESWITSLFGGSRSTSHKVSAAGQGSPPRAAGGSTGDLTAMRRSGSDPRSEAEHAVHDGVPTVITTSASTSLPTADSGSVHQHYGAADAEQSGGNAHPAYERMLPESLLLAPAGAAENGSNRPASPSDSHHSNVSAETDDSEERRLWASFPTQTRRHPPGLVALDLEQRTLAERRMTAAAHENNAAMQQQQQQQQRLAYGGATPAPGLPGSTLNLSPLMHPSVLVAIGNGAPMVGLPGMLGGVGQVSVSPSEGGLHAIREESWTSSLDSRSQGASGSTRSRGTASAVTASPVDADFPLEQIEEVAVPHHSSNASMRW